MDEWKPVGKDANVSGQLTYEPVFHWIGIARFSIYMGCFIAAFLGFKFLVGLI